MSSNDKRLDKAEPYYKELTKESLESFLLDIAAPEKDRKIVAYTDKGGKIDYEVAVYKEMSSFGNVPFTASDEKDLREALNLKYPEGIYKI